MEFDDEGFGICVPDDDLLGAEPLLVEQVLQYSLYNTSADDLWVVATKGALLGQKVSIGQMMKKYTELRLHLEFGAPLRKTEFTVVALKWPRPPGARVLWSVKAIYEALALDQFRGESWRWTFAGVPRWKSYLAPMGLDRHILKSVQSEAAGCKTHEDMLTPSRIK